MPVADFAAIMKTGFTATIAANSTLYIPYGYLGVVSCPAEHSSHGVMAQIPYLNKDLLLGLEEGLLLKRRALSSLDAPADASKDLKEYMAAFRRLDDA